MKLSRLLLIVGIVAVLGIVALLGSNLSLSSKAALSVISDPTGEKVAIDGQEVGATPFYSDNLSEGEVTLTFGDFSQKIKLTGGALTVVNWILGPAESFSAGEIVWLSPSLTGTELVVISRPAAEVFLGEESLGNSPLSKAVEPGEYSLGIKKEGYFPRTLKIAVKEGYRLNTSVNLSLNPFPVEEKEITSSAKKIKVLDLSTAEPLLLADYTLWVKGVVFWAEKAAGGEPRQGRDEKKSYNYLLTAEGKLYDLEGSEVSLTSLSKQTEAVTLGYLGESGQGLSTAASSTLGKLRTALFPTPAQVLILDTGVGFLRVRSGPGTNYSEIGKAKPGEKYEYLGVGREGGWFKIDFNGREGWVSSQYAKKI